MINKNKKIKKISYSFVIADLFHYGHLRVLKMAKRSSDYHICAALTDDVCEKWHSKNVCTLNERKKVLESSMYVDEVITQNSLDPSDNLKKILKMYKGCEITVFHGDDWTILPGKSFMDNSKIKIKYVSYYNRLSRELIYNHFSKNSTTTLDVSRKYHATNLSLMDTKGQTLKSLSTVVKKSRIEPLSTFTINDYNKNKDIILKLINRSYDKKIIIRSSTSKEDDISESRAGEFLSIQNIDSRDNIMIGKSIDDIIDNYKLKIKNYKNEEILIQNQTENVAISGVIFTRNLKSNAPYYVITYDDITGLTDTVTSGSDSQTIWLNRDIDKYKVPKKWTNLIHSVKEIERIFNKMILDVEFAINKKGEIIIFQVRPLAANSKYFFSTESFDNNTEELVLKYKNYSKKDQIILSDMAFWNPSELIGDNPKPLSFTLFEELIMKKSWNEGIATLGYTNTSKNLIYKAGNKPYINVDLSIDALIPNKLKQSLKTKLKEYYKKRFMSNLSSHDKFEFDIIDSCYIFDKDILKHMDSSITDSEKRALRKALKTITVDMIRGFDIYKRDYTRQVKECISSSNKLKYDDTLQLLENIIANIKLLKKLAIPQFSSAARMAFVSKSLLNSMTLNYGLSEANVSSFYQSLNTVASDYTKDFSCLKKDMFLKKYGHLRSGTYSLSAPKLNDLSLKHDKKIAFKKNVFNKKTVMKIIKECLLDHNMDLKPEQLYKFLSESFVLREYLKFEYTKIISKILDEIKILATNLGISVTDMEYMTIPMINASSHLEDLEECKSFYKNIIAQEKDKYQRNSDIVQNQVISDYNSFYIIQDIISKPNFVTNESISGPVILLDSLNIKNINLKNKIVLIENADPGFDWIFSQNIKALITKYGGIGSHMAIRCAEFNIPAVIGSGNKIYEKLRLFQNIKIDCDSKRIFDGIGNEISN